MEARTTRQRRNCTCGATFNGGTLIRIMRGSMTELASPTSSPTAQVSKPSPVPPRGFPVFSVWLRDLVISLAISAFIIIFLYQPVKGDGPRMMHSLDAQEGILVNRFASGLDT